MTTKYIKIFEGYEYRITRDSESLKVVRIPLKRITAQDVINSCEVRECRRAKKGGYN